MMMSLLVVEGKPLDVASHLAELEGFVREAAGTGLPAHEVERGLWQFLPRLGYELRAHYLALAALVQYGFRDNRLNMINYLRLFTGSCGASQAGSSYEANRLT